MIFWDKEKKRRCKQKLKYLAEIKDREAAIKGHEHAIRELWGKIENLNNWDEKKSQAKSRIR